MAGAYHQTVGGMAYVCMRMTDDQRLVCGRVLADTLASVVNRQFKLPGPPTPCFETSVARHRSRPHRLPLGSTSLTRHRRRRERRSSTRR